MTPRSILLGAYIRASVFDLTKNASFYLRMTHRIFGRAPLACQRMPRSICAWTPPLGFACVQFTNKLTESSVGFRWRLELSLEYIRASVFGLPKDASFSICSGATRIFGRASSACRRMPRFLFARGHRNRSHDVYRCEAAYQFVNRA